jgi:hypothetical protein
VILGFIQDGLGQSRREQVKVQESVAPSMVSA